MSCWERKADYIKSQISKFLHLRQKDGNNSLSGVRRGGVDLSDQIALFWQVTFIITILDFC